MLEIATYVKTKKRRFNILFSLPSLIYKKNKNKNKKQLRYWYYIFEYETKVTILNDVVGDQAMPSEKRKTR